MSEIHDEFFWMRKAAAQIADHYRQYGCPRNEQAAAIIEAEYMRAERCEPSVWMYTRRPTEENPFEHGHIFRLHKATDLPGWIETQLFR